MAQTTKRALAASFKELLAQKPFNKITISDITQHCGVNRMTFYYHFQDLIDVIDWSLRRAMEELVEESTMAFSNSPGQITTITLPDGTVVNLNADSRIEYPAVFYGDERRVRLEGEAIFDVVHDEEKPFVVETFRYDIKVLGTKFDVTAESGKDRKKQCRQNRIDTHIKTQPQTAKRSMSNSPTDKNKAFGNNISSYHSANDGSQKTTYQRILKKSIIN